MISKDVALKLKARQQIFDLISKHPGIHISEMSRKLNIPKTTLLYHIRYLLKLDLIKESNENGYRRFFIPNQINAREKKLLGLFRQKIACRIYLHLNMEKVCSRLELSEELELSPDTIQYYLDKMINLEVIEKAPVENGFAHPYPENPNYKVKIKPVGREVFYVLKSVEGRLFSIYNLLVTHKEGLPDKEFIKTYLDYYERYIEFCEYNKNRKFKNDKSKRTLNKDDEALKVLSDYLKPFFAY